MNAPLKIHILVLFCVISCLMFPPRSIVIDPEIQDDPSYT